MFTDVFVNCKFSCCVNTVCTDMFVDLSRNAAFVDAVVLSCLSACLCALFVDMVSICSCLWKQL